VIEMCPEYPSIDKVKEFFFKGMVEGYAGQGARIALDQLPGYKANSFGEGDWYLLDCWCGDPLSGRSAGTTTIWYRNNPVWVMHFGGQYPQEVIPTLKAALRQSYQNQEFLGGRGPRTYGIEPYIYVNVPRVNDFSLFEGREGIRFNRDQMFGWHDYWGMSLMP
jgi:hypothetical protein